MVRRALAFGRRRWHSLGMAARSSRPLQLNRRAILRAGAFAGAALLVPGCRREAALVADGAFGVRGLLPQWRERHLEGDEATGVLERVHPKGVQAGRVQLAWEVDARAGLLLAEAAAAFSSLGDGARIAQAARLEEGGRVPRGALDAGGHSATLVEAGTAQALVWRCPISGRSVRLVRDGLAPPLEQLLPGLRCHKVGDRAVNGEVPTAAATLLGPGWRLARRNPAAAHWLQDEALLTLFAGQLTPPPKDLVEAGRLAPGWAEAAGLKGAQVLTGTRAPGPQGHPAVRLQGAATLDGRELRWALLQWRCVVRKRTFGALVAARPLAAAASEEWTGHDGALLAARCHGS